MTVHHHQHIQSMNVLETTHLTGGNLLSEEIPSVILWIAMDHRYLDGSDHSVAKLYVSCLCMSEKQTFVARNTRFSLCSVTSVLL